MFNLENTKYHVIFTSRFKKQFKKSLKQNKDENKFLEILDIIANGKQLEEKYKNHKLIDNNKYNKCYECHIEPDWLLVYEIKEEKLVLILTAIGSHSNLFK